MNDIVARVLAEKLDRLTAAIEHLTITLGALGAVQDPQKAVLEKIASANADVASAMERVADVQEAVANRGDISTSSE